MRRSLVGSLRSRPGPSSTNTGDPTISRKDTHSLTQTPRRTRGNHPVPSLDREADLIVKQPVTTRKDSIFEQYIAVSSESIGPHPLLSLPINIRRTIYSHCFREGLRKICLSPHFATKAVFPANHFASPWDVLEPVIGAIHSFSSLRREIMIYFWTTYHFHVTLSMFSGPKFSPLSNIWLFDYLHIVQQLSLEVDLTLFGCSASDDALQFGHDYSKVGNQVSSIVDGLLKRKADSPLYELNLLCRRYTGIRPSVSDERHIKCKGKDIRFQYERTN
jgi:hypothetical protein